MLHISISCRCHNFSDFISFICYFEEKLRVCFSFSFLVPGYLPEFLFLWQGFWLCVLCFFYLYLEFNSFFLSLICQFSVNGVWRKSLPIYKQVSLSETSGLPKVVMMLCVLFYTWKFPCLLWAWSISQLTIFFTEKSRNVREI